MNSGAGDTTQLVPGFPIRTPWDHSSVDSSPRPIAASHVLHRLLVPRHPPFALSNLTTKMLASTVQFSTNNHPHRHPHHTTPPGEDLMQRVDDHPEQSPPPTTSRTPPPKPGGTGFVLSGPNRMLEFTTTSRTTPTPSTPHPHQKRGGRAVLELRWPLPAMTRQCLRR